jgi:hypothetical protein
MTVSGRLVDAQQKPVPASLLNLETEDQASATLMRGFEVSTDAAGRFEFTHMPAETKFRMQTPAKEVESMNGGLVARVITTGTNGSTLALGDLAMSPARFVRGRVVLKDGKVVPDRSRVTMSFDGSGPSRTSTLDPEGWFEFAGLLGGPVSLQVQIQGYRISAKNPSKDWLNEGRLVGVLQSDHEEFLIELEPAKGTPPPAPATNRQPRDKPLRPATLE